MNKEDVRRARLRALGVEDEAHDSSAHSDPDSHRAEKKERTDEETAAPINSASAASPGPDVFEMRPELLASVTELLISANTQPDDMVRWFSQGCQFMDNPNYCLRQLHGGPCGVLAAIEAEMLKSIYFGDHKEAYSGNILIPGLSEDRVKLHFIAALFHIFQRALSDTSILMVFCDMDDVSVGEWPRNMRVQRITNEAVFNKFVNDHFDIFGSMSGCVLLTLSLVLTRGVDAVASDMDDRSNGLIGSFGHCNQELVNLLLTGRAVSNVFDGTKPLGDSGLVLKGIQERNDIGYLTHLESMRYCQVGSFYKVPRFPIWVVGSSSHFTVLFSLNDRVNAETDEEMLLSRVKREFRQADHEENGYIPMERLECVLISLSIDVESMTVQELNSLKLLLDPESCGIILFGVFWSVVSQLMSGSRISQLLENFSSKAASADSSAMVIDDSAPAQRERSDSEIARALQDEWNDSSDSARMSVVPVEISTPAAAPAGIPRSDSDLARALQEEWNASPSDSPGVVAVASTPAPVSAGSLDIMSIVSAATAPRPAAAPETGTPAHTPAPSQTPDRKQIDRHDSVADEHSEKFVMYHYNGLSTVSAAPQMVSFELQKRASSNDVGHQIAMDANFGGFYAGINSCDIEELLKTRWPGCRLSWVGSMRPRLD